MLCVYWQCVSMVTLDPEDAARLARPWLQKANAPFTGSLPGAASQYPDVLTQVLSSSMRTETGPSHLEAPLASRIAGHRPIGDHHLPLSGLVTAWLFGERGRDGPPDLVPRCSSPSAVKSR